MRLLPLLLVALTLGPLAGLAQSPTGAAPLAGSAPVHADLVPYDVQVYPIPVRSTLHVEFHAPESGLLHVSCVDLLGRSLLTDMQLEVGGAGRLTHDLRLESLQAGSYVLRLVYQPQTGERPLVLHRRIAVE